MFSSRSRDLSSRKEPPVTEARQSLARVSENELVVKLPREIYSRKVMIEKFSISLSTMSTLEKELNTSTELGELIFREYKRYLLLLAFFG